VGLGIGRVVFTALNLVEPVALVVVGVALLTAGTRPVPLLVAAAVTGALLAGPLLGVRPALGRRADRVLTGEDLPRRRHRAVDAIEIAFAQGFITTFAIGTGDSDFIALLHKLPELDKRVLGIGVQSSTSALLPPACDEFLFYDRLPGVEPGQPTRRGRTRARP
jgi:hypothetical protein